MIERDLSKSPFFNELVDQLRRVKLEALPDVVAMLRRASGGEVAPGSAKSGQSPDELARSVLEMSSEGSKLDLIQRAVVKHALATTGGNVSAAARLLGIDRKALERKLARYGRGESDED